MLDVALSFFKADDSAVGPYFVYHNDLRTIYYIKWSVSDIYIYIWKLNQIVLELDLRAVKFLFFPRRDLNPHHCYTAATFA
jgi:hypothetical protein